MIAWFAGLCTMVIAFWTWFVDRRRWMKVLSLWRSRNNHSARDPWRCDCAAVSAACDFERACHLGANVLLHRSRDHCFHWTQVGGGGSAAAGRLWPAKAAGVVSLLDRLALRSAD